eukprot:SAG11_NODE_30361_length_301_cov_2.707921_1_plen_31_part_10
MNILDLNEDIMSKIKHNLFFKIFNGTPERVW